jgi:hypothetical protein
MTPEQACKFTIPFGKYKGKTLDQIATTDPAGPGYLDWMVKHDNLSPDFKDALKSFLAIHWVQELVERSVEDQEGRSGSTEPVENRKKLKNWWEK